jgi:hypothetical protein
VRLGEILVKHGLITEAQLYSALARREADGKRIGSYLVEKGILTANQVALALAEQVGVPPALDADFVRAEPAARRRLSARQAAEFQAIPLFVTGSRRVAVAMANPTNPSTLDKLAFILGATVEPMIATDLAITKHLESLYRAPRPDSANTGLSLGTQPRLSQPLAGNASRPEATEIRPALRTHRRPAKAMRLVPLLPGATALGTPEPGAPVAVMEDAMCFTPTPLTFFPPAPALMPPTPTRVAARHPLTPIVVPMTRAGTELAVEQIRFATDQQDVSDNLFTFMRACFGVGAMFSVEGAVAQGRFGFSSGAVRPEVEGIAISLSLPSCFRIARSRRATFRGTPPPDGMAVHRALWAALRCQPAKDAIVSPVIVDGQVTLLLYAHGEGGEALDNLAASRMEQVCEALSSSLLRLAV